MQARFRSTVVLAILLLPAYYATTQQSFSFRKCYGEDSLSNGFFTSTFQDSRGFLWLGNANGLNAAFDFGKPNYFSIVFFDFYGFTSSEVPDKITLTGGVVLLQP